MSFVEIYYTVSISEFPLSEVLLYMYFSLELRERVSEHLEQFRSQFTVMEGDYHTMRDKLTQYCQV